MALDSFLPDRQISPMALTSGTRLAIAACGAARTYVVASNDEVVAYFSRPFPAIVAALTIVVGFMHFKNGVQVLIEDYVHGMAQQVLIILMICLSYAAAATGVFAIARIAL